LTRALERLDDGKRDMPVNRTHPLRNGLPADWARSIIDAAAFTAEQEKFAHVWTFLGLVVDVAKEGDWIKASLGLRSVFVQRIRGELKGFENRCAHRFYPLRTADKGNGPIVCGFHHWSYDGDGRALGIPMCVETFGVVARGMNARLTPIEVAVCGTLIFGRFPSPEATGTLKDFLGAAFPIIAGLSRMTRRPRHFSLPIEAHWKLCMHVAIDDYHLSAIHPRTFGKIGYLSREHITYTRVGAHSVFQSTNAANTFSHLASTIAEGTASSDHYVVLHLMPNVSFAQAYVGGGYYSCVLIQFVPESHKTSRQRVWTFRSPLKRGRGGVPRLLQPFMDPFIAILAKNAARCILREDATAAERLQTNAAGFIGSPLIGALEERIVWFENAYRLIMADQLTETPL